MESVIRFICKTPCREWIQVEYLRLETLGRINNWRIMDCVEPASRWIGKRGRSRNLMLEFEQDSAIGIRSQGLGMIYFRRVAAAHEDGCVHAMHCKFEILQQWKHLISRFSSSHSAFSLEKPCSPRLNILTSRLVRKNWTKQRSTLNLNTTDLAARSLALLLFRAYTVS